MVQGLFNFCVCFIAETRIYIQKLIFFHLCLIGLCDFSYVVGGAGQGGPGQGNFIYDYCCITINIFVFLSVLLGFADQDLNLFPSSQEAVGMVDRCSQECFMDTPSNHPKCKV